MYAGNSILKVGGEDLVAYTAAHVVDAKGGVVVPGFHDAHVHMLDGGLSLSMAQLASATTLQQTLQLVKQWGITHTQLVPTMFSRMLKLPEEVRRRYDLSTLEIAIHAAAPCPAAVKDDMIKWWGPIINEYYGATEGLGFTACDSK